MQRFGVNADLTCVQPQQSNLEGSCWRSHESREMAHARKGTLAKLTGEFCQPLLVHGHGVTEKRKNLHNIKSRCTPPPPMQGHWHAAWQTAKRRQGGNCRTSVTSWKPSAHKDPRCKTLACSATACVCHSHSTRGPSASACKCIQMDMSRMSLNAGYRITLREISTK